MISDPEQLTQPLVTHPEDKRPVLHHRSVTLPNGKERVTIFPAAADEITRLTTWVTVDSDCVIDLYNLR